MSVTADEYDPLGDEIEAAISQFGLDSCESSFSTGFFGVRTDTIHNLGMNYPDVTFQVTFPAINGHDHTAVFAPESEPRLMFLWGRTINGDTPPPGWAVDIWRTILREKLENRGHSND